MNLSFRFTVILTAITGVAVGLGFFSWIAVTVVTHENEDVLKERLTIAYAAAGYLDNSLASVHALLDTAVDFENGLPSESEFLNSERLIREAFGHFGIKPKDVVIVNDLGAIVMDTPEVPEMLGGVGYSAWAYPAVAKALQTRTYSVSEVVFDPGTQMPVVLLVSPILKQDSSLDGAVIVEVSIKQLHLLFLSPDKIPGIPTSPDGQDNALGSTGYLELVDSAGVIIDRTQPGPTVEQNEKSAVSDQFVNLIIQKKSDIIICPGPTRVPQQTYVVAFSPLSTVPWGVVIWQSEAEMLDTNSELIKRLVFYGLIFLAISVVVTWFGSRRLLNPLKELTEASRRVGEGNFEVMLPTKRQDEIGKLATAFRTMTGQLSQSRDTLSKLYRSEKEKEELRGRLLEEVVSAQEEERKRLARELHDELAQNLTALIMRLESLENSLAIGETGFKNDLAKASEIAVQVLDSIRNLTFDLRPLDLDVLGLVPAIRRFVDHHQEESQIDFIFEARLSDPRLPAPLETALFRIAQELIRNIEKHASAETVHIKIEKIDQKIILHVEDDGKGFSPEMVYNDNVKGKSFGLIGIRERIELLGGDLKIDSEPGKGTRVTVIIPLPAAE